MKNIFYSLLLSFLIMTPAIADTIVRIAPLTKSIIQNTTSVSGTAVAVPAVAMVGRENITLYNVTNATETVWCGASSTTSANGFPLTSSAPAISLDVNDDVIIYCISDGSVTDVRSIETK